MPAKTHRPARPRYTGAPEHFTKSTVSFTHWDTGFTFTTRAGRMNVFAGDGESIGTKYVYDYELQQPTPTPSEAILRRAAARWLADNPECVEEYGYAQGNGRG